MHASVARARNFNQNAAMCLLFPFPFHDHMYPMLQLAGILHRHGFAVTVFHTHLNVPDPARYPDYRFVPVPGSMSGPVPAGIEDAIAHFIATGTVCEAAFRDRLAAVVEEYSRDAIACLIADAHLLPMFEVATTMAVPTLALRSCSAACYACFLAYPMLCDKGLVRGCVPVASRLPEVFEAPQEEVLRYAAVGGFLTHGEWGSTTESVSEGVPMLCRPFVADQMGDARYVEHKWKVGLEVRGELERGSIQAAIRRVMTEKDGAEMRARAGELKKAAMECTGKAGSSRMAIDKLVTHIMSLFGMTPTNTLLQIKHQSFVPEMKFYCK